MGATAPTYIKRALMYVGYREGANNANRFSAELGRGPESWCDDFVSGVAFEVGASDIFGSHAYCPEHVEWFKNRGEWHNGSSGITTGDIGFVEIGGKAGHVFAVVSANKLLRYAVTVEGNTNNNGSANGIGVFKRRRLFGGIMGYGRPRWATGAVVAVPKPKPTSPSGPTSVVGRQVWSMPATIGGVEDFTHVNTWVNIGVGQKYWVAVTAIQGALNAAGYAVRVDGDFGPATLSAVKRFQASRNLVADGLVGVKTAIALRLVTP